MGLSFSCHLYQFLHICQVSSSIDVLKLIFWAYELYCIIKFHLNLFTVFVQFLRFLLLIDLVEYHQYELWVTLTSVILKLTLKIFYQIRYCLIYSYLGYIPHCRLIFLFQFAHQTCEPSIIFVLLECLDRPYLHFNLCYHFILLFRNIILIINMLEFIYVIFHFLLFFITICQQFTIFYPLYICFIFSFSFFSNQPSLNRPMMIPFSFTIVIIIYPFHFLNNFLLILILIQSLKVLILFQFISFFRTLTFSFLMANIQTFFSNIFAFLDLLHCLYRLSHLHLVFQKANRNLKHHLHKCQRIFKYIYTIFLFLYRLISFFYLSLFVERISSSLIKHCIAYVFNSFLSYAFLILISFCGAYPLKFYVLYSFDYCYLIFPFFPYFYQMNTNNRNIKTNLVEVYQILIYIQIQFLIYHKLSKFLYIMLLHFFVMILNLANKYYLCQQKQKYEAAELKQSKNRLLR